MKLPMKFFESKLIGDLLQRIEDHRRVEQFLTSSSLNLLFSFFTFIVFDIVLAVYNLGIFLVFLLGTSIYSCWIIIFLKKRKCLDYKYFEQAGRNRSITYQLLYGMQEIKLQGCEQRKRWEWEDVQADLFKINMESLNMQQVQQVGSILINEVNNILITVLSATAVVYGNMTLGMMLAVQYIIGQLNSPVEQLVQFIYSWQDVSISLERMNEIHRETKKIKIVHGMYMLMSLLMDILFLLKTFPLNTINIVSRISFLISISPYRMAKLQLSLVQVEAERQHLLNSY